ncbi:achaete-scute homolog 3-like [Carcharodon carcharias]|uniref:achaete-scute homolog 3-like n=1 Tax=Carcharodon carcharias TaxID=13397 RepID=UPI001B7EEF42|nr:achaete-scute homolog 3-like [Carcharodon carcharias]
MIESSMAMTPPDYVYKMETESYESLMERITFGDAACMQMAPSVSADLPGLQSNAEPPRLRHPDEMPMLPCAEHTCSDAFGNDAYPAWHYYPQLPFQNPFSGVYDYSYEPAFIRKRNERERQRVKCVNEGYAQLRQHLPQELSEKRLSKVETLRAAIKYIKELQALLGVHGEHVEREPAGDAVSQATVAVETAWVAASQFPG